MRSELITVEPQTIYFNSEATQVIKVVNKSSSPIHDFFFSLYNNEKFSFSPDSFSLAPNQHRLISVTLKIRGIKSNSKEFVYLKAPEISKRINLCMNNFLSPEAKARSDQGIQDMNTLSSREYREMQNAAINKIAEEQQAYRARRDRVEAGGLNLNARTENSSEKVGVFRKEAEQHQLRAALLQNDNEVLLRQNQLLQEKFEQYRRLCEKDLKDYERTSLHFEEKSQEIVRLSQEITFLEAKGAEFIRKIAQKDERIRELQNSHLKILEQQRIIFERRIENITKKSHDQQENYQIASKASKEKINQLQRIIIEQSASKEQAFLVEKELKRKEEQIKVLMKKLEDVQHVTRDRDEERRKNTKYELAIETLQQKNEAAAQRLRQLEGLNQNLKEQIFVYRNKISEMESSAEKVDQYMNIALESTRSENESLKRGKQELEREIESMIFLNRQSQDGLKLVTDQLHRSKDEVHILNQLRETLERRNQELKQENHLAVMQLRSQNVQLLEKLTLGQHARNQEEERLANEELMRKNTLLAEKKILMEDMQSKMLVLTTQNLRLHEKIKKYKRDARKELKEINEGAVDELRRTNEERNKLSKRVLQLESSLDLEGRTQAKISPKNRPKRTSSIGGIKDQRKDICREDEHLEQNANELAELRELEKFFRSEEVRFTRLFKLQDDSDEPMRPLYRAIRFFRSLQDKLKQRKLEGGRVIVGVEDTLKYSENKIDSSLSLNRTQVELLEFVKAEMKLQYKKFNQALKFAEEKHQTLKKKIYEEYRSRIVEVLSRKERPSLAQIQATLQRFIDAMSNLSHKDALLQKEAKLKQVARREACDLKEKNHELTHLIQFQKGSKCTRTATKVFFQQNAGEWQENLQREAQCLTLAAQYQCLKEELSLRIESEQGLRDQITHQGKILAERAEQLGKVKKSYSELQHNYQVEMERQGQILQEQRRKIAEMIGKGKAVKQSNLREKEIAQLKDDLERKKDIIQSLKEKEQKMQELLEQTTRHTEKQKRKNTEESRVLQSIKEIKDSNRGLRQQNNHLQQRLQKLAQEFEKKNAYLKTFKDSIEEQREKETKKDEGQTHRLREEIQRLVQDLKRNKDEFDRAKKSIENLRSDADRLRNENIIAEKSFESIIRALVETFRKIYSSLRILIKRKKGRDIGDASKLSEITSRVSDIDALRVHEQFQEALKVLQSD